MSVCGKAIMDDSRFARAFVKSRFGTYDYSADLEYGLSGGI
jgi:hypothetical protein